VTFFVCCPLCFSEEKEEIIIILLSKNYIPNHCHISNNHKIILAFS
jgi:hypothetical protein